MSERQLEPTPGWCERAYKEIKDAQKHLDWGTLGPLIKEYEAAKPAPEPLPHEWVGKPFSVFDKCKHCGVCPCGSWLDAEAVYGPCPARNKPEPAAKGAELPEEIGSFLFGVFSCSGISEKERLQTLCRLLLAEVDRRIEASKPTTEGLNALCSQIADERIGKARVFIKIQNRYSRTYDIVPGDKA